MTVDATARGPAAATAGYEGVEPESMPRSLARQALYDTFGRAGARVGAVWLAMVLLAGIFAPFLASSHPILMRENGQWSSPLLRHLTATDVILLLLAFFALGMYASRRLTVPQIGAGLIWLLAVFAPVITWPTWPYPRIALAMMARDVAIVPLLVLAATAGLIGLGMARGKLKWWILAGLVVVHGLYIWRYGVSGYGKVGAQIVALALLFFLLLHAAVIVGVPLLSGAPRTARIVVGALALLVILGAMIRPIHPPEAVSYSRYREDLAIGLVERTITTLIPYSPSDRMRDAIEPQQNLPPSRHHWLGTTPNAEDVLSRMIYASRIAISIGFVSTGIAVVIGCTIGGLMGYFVGKVDIFGMRLIEVFEAIPTLFLLITFVAFYGRNLYIMMAIIGLTGWTGDARFIRAEFLRLRKQDFVQAAIAAGLPLRSILFKHMLPNGIAPVLVTASFGVASAILAEATLSFLGLGLIDEPSWGQMLNQARGVGTDFLWWMAVFPGAAIFLTVFSYNLIGEALRDALDPKFRKRD